MSENPYRKNAELSPRMQRIGGLLFAATLATPFVVITLVGNPVETALMAADDTAIRPFNGAGLIAPPPTDTLALAAAPVGPVSVLRPGGGASPEIVAPAGPAEAGDRAEPASRVPARPHIAATPDRPGATVSEDLPPSAAMLAPTRAPRIITALAHRRGPDDTDLPLSIATERAAEAEHALDLNSGRRREVQLRLSFLGHDPGLVDGIFGEQTRGAIRAAQARFSLPETGYLDDRILGRIEELTDQKLAEFRLAERKRSKQAHLAAKRRRTIDTRVRVPAAKNSPECRRNDAGEITENQSIPCDVSLLEESLEAIFGRGG